jgi:GDP-4-dehydro-6-deoxy-D-mannose reductase
MSTYERILITGGAGFVGAHVTEALRRAYIGARIVVVTRPHESASLSHVETRACDLTDEAAVEEIVADLTPDLVIHLASQSSVGQASRLVEQTWRVNALASCSLGAAVMRHAPSAVMFFASSATVYGASFRDGVLSEDAPLQPLDVYARSKVAAEYMLSDLFRATGRLVIVRPVNHSGPGQRSNDFVLPSFAAQVVDIETGRVEPCMKVGDLSRIRDFLDVRDVVEAYVRLIAIARRLNDNVTVFNVSSGTGYAISALLEELRTLSRKDFNIEIDPQRMRPSAMDISSVICDSSRLRAATGWAPAIPIRETIRALLDERRAEMSGGLAL